MIAHPCGLIANTFFNDSYELFDGANPVMIDEKNIAWPSDRRKVKNSPDWRKEQWIDMEDGTNMMQSIS